MDPQDRALQFSRPAWISAVSSCYPGLNSIFQLPRGSFIKHSVIPSVRKKRDDLSVVLFYVQ